MSAEGPVESDDTEVWARVLDARACASSSNFERAANRSAKLYRVSPIILTFCSCTAKFTSAGPAATRPHDRSRRRLISRAPTDRRNLRTKRGLRASHPVVPAGSVQER